MSWLRSAVNRAVEVRGNTNISRTFLSVADSVAQHAGQAVAGVPKLLQDRLVARAELNRIVKILRSAHPKLHSWFRPCLVGVQKTQSFKLAVKRLEEVSVSCRGVERVQLLRRWLVSLKEIERFYGNNSMYSEKDAEQLPTSTRLSDSPNKPDLVLFYDPDLGGEPMNFRDVFLRSQALEGVVLSMILEEPDEEELTLLLGIFRICLIGGEEVQDATVRSIKELAIVFSSYDGEVLAKKEELLQCAQDAIAGLKVNADLLRIDSEVSKIRQTLDEMDHQTHSTEMDELSGYRTLSTTKGLKAALKEVQLCSRLEELLLQKKTLKLGESPEIHAQKVDKFKVLSESLANSASKAEKRISENRSQKEDALKFRVTKTTEISQIEKEITAEIEVLKKRKDELEAELKTVNMSMASACARLRNAREEREQFDDASIKILLHFKTRDDELLRSISSYKAESDVCSASINFLESTWISQSAYAEQTEKQVNEELEKYEASLVNMAINLLSSYKDELGPLVSSFAELSKKFRSFETAMNDERKDDGAPPGKKVEMEYLNVESKLSNIFNILETLRRQFHFQDDGKSNKNDERVKELFDAVEKFKHEFDSIEKPTLNVETPTLSRTMSLKEVSDDGMRKRWFSGKYSPPTRTHRSPFEESSEILGYEVEYPDKFLNNKMILDPKVQLSNLQLELELEDSGKDHSAEELNDWEFDNVA